MGEVIDLCLDENVRIDPDRLAQLVGDLGIPRAEAVFGRALAEMQAHLAEVERTYRRGDVAAICRHARSLSRLAEQIGMPAFCRVARDVDRCAGRGDMVAFAATMARLDRIADRSLGALRTVRGMSG